MKEKSRIVKDRVETRENVKDVDIRVYYLPLFTQLMSFKLTLRPPDDYPLFI